ncbi:MAG: hypothetical protein RLN75_03560, partial [Longimicrobiales bacterium]
MNRATPSPALSRAFARAFLGPILAVSLGACGSDSPAAPDTDDPDSGDRVAVLKVLARTDGLLLDPDGYTVTLDGGPPGSLATNGEWVVQAEPGPATLTFSGLASNCTPHGNPGVYANLVNRDTTVVEFAVTCFRDPIAFGMIVDPDAGWEIYLMEASGGPAVPLTTLPGMDDNFLTTTGHAFNPERTHVALQSGDRDDGFGEYDVFVMALNKSEFVHTTLPGPEFAPAWAADGSRIVFSGYDWGGTNTIFVASPDLVTVEQITPDGPAWDGSPILSPDGSRIAFTRDDDVFVMGVDGSNPVNVSDPGGT